MSEKNIEIAKGRIAKQIENGLKEANDQLLKNTGIKTSPSKSIRSTTSKRTISGRTIPRRTTSRSTTSKKKYSDKASEDLDEKAAEIPKGMEQKEGGDEKPEEIQILEEFNVCKTLNEGTSESEEEEHPICNDISLGECEAKDETHETLEEPETVKIYENAEVSEEEIEIIDYIEATENGDSQVEENNDDNHDVTNTLFEDGMEIEEDESGDIEIMDYSEDPGELEDPEDPEELGDPEGLEEPEDIRKKTEEDPGLLEENLEENLDSPKEDLEIEVKFGQISRNNNEKGPKVGQLSQLQSEDWENLMRESQAILNTMEVNGMQTYPIDYIRIHRQDGASFKINVTELLNSHPGPVEELGGTANSEKTREEHWRKNNERLNAIRKTLEQEEPWNLCTRRAEDIGENSY